MKKIGGLSFIAALFIFAILLIAPKAHAQQFGITAYPAIVDVSANPGETVRFLMQFKNETSAPITGTVKLANFTIADKQGGTRLIEDAGKQPTYGAAQWITPDQPEITINPNDYVAVNFSAAIPKNANTCGTYAVPYFEYDQPEAKGTGNSSASVISAKVGGIVMIRINNVPCTESAQVQNFTAPGFLENGPVPVTFSILNTGTIHVMPKGNVSMTNLFNKTEAQKAIKDQRIFPQTLKNYALELGKQFMIGKFTIALAATYGTPAQPLTASTDVWIIPWRLILIIVLFIVILYIIITRFRRGMLEKEERLETELKKESDEIKELKEMLEKKHE